MIRIVVLIITTLITMNSAYATFNCIIITDPSGQDDNGAAAGSISYDTDMFQSTFLYSSQNKFAILSGGTDTSTSSGASNDTNRLNMVIQSIRMLESGGSASSASSIANSYSGQRLVVGGPKIGAAVTGTSGNYVVEVDDNGTITVTPYSSGTGVLPPGKKGAVLHLLHTPGNPQPDNTSAVGLATAEMIGEEIRDGYSATNILADADKMVAVQSGEKYGGGAVNLASGVSTEDMFTPAAINQTGYPMDQAYYKYDNTTGWSVSYPAAESYTTSPYGNPLQTIYAYDALRNAITVSQSNATVYTYGTDDVGITATTSELVNEAVSSKGLDATAIVNEINSGIKSGLLVGVNPVESSDINIVNSTKQVGVYYTAIPGNRTAPQWDLPISSSTLSTIGNLEIALGLIVVILVVFRSTLISSFVRRRKKL